MTMVGRIQNIRGQQNWVLLFCLEFNNDQKKKNNSLKLTLNRLLFDDERCFFPFGV